MTDYREILRLCNLRYSQRAIARSVRCSRNTVENASLREMFPTCTPSTVRNTVSGPAKIDCSEPSARTF